MKNEIPYFNIGDACGGNQDWFHGYMMRLGGCAAATACDSSICLAQNSGKTELCPFGTKKITREDYVTFAGKMEPYLRPRPSGIDTLDIFIDGYEKYTHDSGCGIAMEPLPGDAPVEDAAREIIQRIDREIPLPCLVLHHKNPNMKFYVWHWFVIAGYESFEDEMMVKAVTYGSWRWLPLRELWYTGYKRKGGLILFNL